MFELENNKIYNSRNYKCLIDSYLNDVKDTIYNSRNYKCLIDKIDKLENDLLSTIVEIINVL